MLKQIICVSCVVLLYWVVQSNAHHDTYAASLGGAPVGLYGRRHSHGHGHGHRHGYRSESESAASLGNAPVGLYHRHHHHHRRHRTYLPVLKYPVYGSRPVRRPAYRPPSYRPPGIQGRRPGCYPPGSPDCEGYRIF